jgi:hypothetical protein
MGTNETTNLVVDLTPATLHQLVAGQVATLICERFPTLRGLIRVSGVLADPGPPRGQWHYGVNLSGDGHQIEVNLPATIVARRSIVAGLRVRVTGALRPRVNRQGVIELRIDASDVELDRTDHAPRDEPGRIGVQQLKALPLGRRRFPLTGAPLRVTLIHSASVHAQVADDCLGELVKLGGAVVVTRVPLNILDPGAIAQAIGQARTDIVMLIRGGGAAADFEVFDDARVVSALAGQSAYRVIGLGHSGNATLLDLICDHSARTPAQAGLHVREMVEEQVRQWRAMRGLALAARQYRQADAPARLTMSRILDAAWTHAAAIDWGRLAAAAILGGLAAMMLLR